MSSIWSRTCILTVVSSAAGSEWYSNQRSRPLSLWSCVPLQALCFFVPLPLALTSWLSPNWTQKGFFFGHLSCQKNPKKLGCMFDPFTVFLPASVFPPWPISSGECTRVCPNKPLWARSGSCVPFSSSSNLRLSCTLVSLAGGRGGCSWCHLCTDFFFIIILFFFVLLGLQIMCQIFKKESEQLSPSLAKASSSFHKTQIAQTLQTDLCFSLRKKTKQTYWICLEVLRDADKNPTGLKYLP